MGLPLHKTRTGWRPRVLTVVGLLAAASWLVSAAVVSVGAFVGGHNIALNLFLAAIFALCGWFLGARTRLAEAVFRALGDEPIARSHWRQELTLLALALCVGLGVLSGCASRVFLEGMSVFG